MTTVSSTDDMDWEPSPDYMDWEPSPDYMDWELSPDYMDWEPSPDYMDWQPSLQKAANGMVWHLTNQLPNITMGGC